MGFRSSLSEHHRQLWKLEALIEKAPDDDDDLDAEGKDKDGRKAPLVLTVQPQHMNLTGRMARQFWFTDEEATIQFYADAVRQLRTAESSAAPKSEEELQRIIKAQCYRVHPYLYLSDDLKLADWSDTQWRLDDAHHGTELYYMPKLDSVGQTVYQLDPTCQELDWIKQHAQWLYGKKKAFQVASPLGLMCSIEAMEQCIARKSHELSARQSSATPTTDASPFPLSQLTRAGDAPLPESTDNGVSEVRYIVELVPSSPAKEPQRRRTRL